MGNPNPSESGSWCYLAVGIGCPSTNRRALDTTDSDLFVATDFCLRVSLSKASRRRPHGSLQRQDLVKISDPVFPRRIRSVSPSHRRAARHRVVWMRGRPLQNSRPFIPLVHERPCSSRDLSSLHPLPIAKMTGKTTSFRRNLFDLRPPKCRIGVGKLSSYSKTHPVRGARSKMNRSMRLEQTKNE